MTCKGDECRYEILGCHDCWPKLHDDAAAAIEALESKVEPRKLGRWEKAKPKGVVMYSDGYAECSSCNEAIWLGWSMNFCAQCGVQNRIIDSDDIAKLEVQDD